MFRGFPGLTPAVQLVEGIDAALEVGEQRKLTGGLLDRGLRRDRAQQRRDAPRRLSLPVARALDRRRAVPGVKVIEDLLLEILQPHAQADAAGTARAEHHVSLSELGPFAQQPGRFDRGGELLCSHALRLDAVDVQHRRDVVVLQQDLLFRDAPVSLAENELVLRAPEKRVAFPGARKEDVAHPG